MASIWQQWAADPRYQQLLSDPTYLAATPQYKKQVHDLLFNYGIQPTAEMQDTYGTGPIESNPYSVVNMLQKGLTSANHSSINAANAAGLEESGAAVGALNANNENYKQQYAQTTAKAGSDLASLLMGYTGTVGNIFNNLEQAPVDPMTPTPNLNPGTAEADRPLAPNGQPQNNPWHIPVGPQNDNSIAATLLKPKKIKSGITGGLGMGHIT